MPMAEFEAERQELLFRAQSAEAECNTLTSALDTIIRTLERRKTRVNMQDGMSMATFARSVLANAGQSCRDAEDS